MGLNLDRTCAPSIAQTDLSTKPSAHTAEGRQQRRQPPQEATAPTNRGPCLILLHHHLLHPPPRARPAAGAAPERADRPVPAAAGGQDAAHPLPAPRLPLHQLPLRLPPGGHDGVRDGGAGLGLLHPGRQGGAGHAHPHQGQCGSGSEESGRVCVCVWKVYWIYCEHPSDPSFIPTTTTQQPIRTTRAAQSIWAGSRSSWWGSSSSTSPARASTPPDG